MLDYDTLSPVVEGYPGRQSYRPGEELTLHCTSRVGAFSVEIARIGNRREVVWSKAGIAGREQPVPDEAYAKGCGWPASFGLSIPADWRSGFYEVALIADGLEGPEAVGRAFFVLRAAEPGSDCSAVLVIQTNTYNAYNRWGGECLYTGKSRVSFQRPIEYGYLARPADPDGFDGRAANVTPEPDPDHHRLQRYLRQTRVPVWTTSAGWYNWERRFVRWAEDAGLHFDYAVNSDLEFRPEILEPYRLLLSVGHDEYWSRGMRDAVDAHLGRGGNLAVFSGNTVYWQVRYEDGGETMVCHKYAARETDPVMGTDRQSALTSIWSDPLIGRPENLTTGLSFCRGGYVRFGSCVPRSSGAYTIHRPDHWAFEGTGLRYGDALGLGSHIVGYEVDGCDLALVDGLPRPTGIDGTPENMEVLATAPAHLISNGPAGNETIVPLSFDPDAIGDLEFTATTLFGEATPAATARLARGHAVMGCFRHPGGGTVFNAGTADWAYGLDADALVQRVTRNVLTRLG
ncbi:MAG: DUF4350 domain-containing protein [Bauldia sp.]|nr:DUF4350 domain-containing protein [Bauldia sp.]